MKNVLIILILSGIVSSCSNDNDEQIDVNPELIGKWRLIETLNDPGDESGVYESIVSEKTIEFSADGTFIINGPLCELSTLIGEDITGRINSSQNSSDNILISNEECEFDKRFNTTYEFNTEYGFRIENSNLIIYWTACVEACRQKYQKLQIE